ncbi:hypothetical protein llap_8992 [Limosa lapponica baueri]|uniref:Uncharacterized protein n=1 Tax=Limosa lapponica baueri TaxID=1758121 RepID=A0A2I0U3U6_LIMLA|nr:hypothetical protein llap_8992 [Limosa lapponica baueri]
MISVRSAYSSVDSSPQAMIPVRSMYSGVGSSPEADSCQEHVVQRGHLSMGCGSCQECVLRCGLLSAEWFLSGARIQAWTLQNGSCQECVFQPGLCRVVPVRSAYSSVGFSPQAMISVRSAYSSVDSSPQASSCQECVFQYGLLSTGWFLSGSIQWLPAIVQKGLQWQSFSNSSTSNKGLLASPSCGTAASEERMLCKAAMQEKEGTDPMEVPPHPGEQMEFTIYHRLDGKCAHLQGGKNALDVESELLQHEGEP